MKKLLAFVCALALVGCSSPKKEEVVTKVCEGEYNGLPTTLTFEAKGDSILTQKQASVTSLEDLGVSEEEIIAAAETVAEQYADVKGVTYTYEIKENKLYEEFKFDYAKENLSDLQELGLVTSTTDKEIDYISLKQSIEQYEKDGFTCK